jgi:hypothetical protein
MEVPDIERVESFHEVFLNTATSCDININHFVLAEVSYVLSHTARRHIGGATHENCAPSVLANLFRSKVSWGFWSNRFVT